jgi:threonylcarbamoyladenosine tRNA methylthiotransferase MtaB
MRVAFKTFGCRLNRADTDRFIAGFVAAGWQIVAENSEADVVIIHGCAITHAAERDGLRAAHNAKQRAIAKNHLTEPLVVLVGCIVETGTAPLPQNDQGADLVVTRKDLDRLPSIVATALAAKRPLGMIKPSTPTIPALKRKRALLKVQDGCNFGCAYCIVPRTRGAPVSRPFQECLDEAKSFLDSGFNELVLTGCNLGCYQYGRYRLPEFALALLDLGYHARIRFSSIEPLTVEKELADLMAENKRLCHHLHLPLQSGDADILKAMGRRYTPEEYEETLSHIIARVPQIGLGCDVIVGLPGENATAFENTRSLLMKWPFSNIHVFTYSERPGTRAVNMPGQIPVAERRTRTGELLKMLPPKKASFAASFIGKPVEVLIESFNATQNSGKGWTDTYLPAVIYGVNRRNIGQLITFTPTATKEGTLHGNIQV